MTETVADQPTDPEADTPRDAELDTGPSRVEAGSYDAGRFWEARLRGRFDLTGAGFRGLGNAFNRALYRQREVVLGRALRRFDLEPLGAAIVELGPGTGFYVRFWQDHGAASVVGLDITAVVTERLAAEYPQFRFAQADATQRWPVEDASSDLVTAFDILFHIVDDAGFHAALNEAGRVARPGGYFLISDLFVHGEAFRGFHQVSRSLGEYEAALDAAGFDVLGRLPIFVTMHPALDLPSGVRRRMAERWWAWLEQTLLDNPRRGYRLGSLLFWIDRALTRPLRGGPSTELLVARRR